MKLRKSVCINLEDLSNAAEVMGKPYPVALAEVITTWSENACLYLDGEVVGGGFEIFDEYNTKLCIDIDCNVSDDVYKSYEELLKITSIISDRQLGFISSSQASKKMVEINPIFQRSLESSYTTDEMFYRYRKENIYWKWKNSKLPSL